MTVPFLAHIVPPGNWNPPLLQGASVSPSKAPTWVSASVLLPPEGEQVIIYDRSLGMRLVGFNTGTASQWFSKAGGRGARFKLADAYWMSFPEPPEKS